MLYKELAAVYEKLSSTSKRLEKTFYLSELIKKTDEKDIDKVILLVQGRLFPTWESAELGVASKIALKAISSCSGHSIKEIEEEWKKTGDLGKVAQNLFTKKKQQSLFAKELTVEKVFSGLTSISTLEGTGAVEKKVALISELLIMAESIEAKYIIRTVLGDLRVGVGQGSIRDAIVWAFFGEELGISLKEGDIGLSDEKRIEYNTISSKVSRAFDLTNDFASVIKTIRQKGISGLDNIGITLGNPISAMLFIKAKNIEDAFSTVGKPAAFEYKYDGFRIQIHKSKNDVKLFTRRLEDVTVQFPEVSEYVKSNVFANCCILDAEVVGFEKKTGKYMPFQSISQRIKRKYDVKRLSEEFPVEVNVFDILFFDDKSLLNEEFLTRRKTIEKIINVVPKKIVIAKQIITDDIVTAQKFYESALSDGQEGVMAKSLTAAYKPGARVGYGVKVKPIMDPLDLVIVKAEYGEGKRSGWLTSFTLACIDKSTDTLLEIGKASTGLKELESEGLSFSQMTEMLLPLITSRNGKSVIIKPSVVIEVLYEEIQKSPTYSSGYALRFPRISRLRDEKPVDEISTINDIERLYNEQGAR
ncbi:MAG: ATP-dependent DNA ligase [archaeon]